MTTTIRHLARRSLLVLLALVLAAAVGSCGSQPGGGEIVASNRSDASPPDASPSGDPSGDPAEDDEAAAGSNRAGEPEEVEQQGGVDPSDEAALGEITDPSETEDPSDTTNDTTPDSMMPAELREIRTNIHKLFEQDELRLAGDLATTALERTDLGPDFRRELEAYRDLARAADIGDGVAAGDAIDRLQRLEPEFVDDLAVRRVLPDGLLPKLELDDERMAAPVDGGTDPESAVGPATDASSNGTSTIDTSVKLDALVEALAVEDWKLARRLAGEALASGALSSEDTARVRLYGQLAEAHTSADADAVAEATDSLAAIDPDLARRLGVRFPSVDIDAESSGRFDG